MKPDELQRVKNIQAERVLKRWPIPSDQLATLAAQLLSRCDGVHAKAIEEAKRLWISVKLDEHPELIALLPSIAANNPAYGVPESFPVTFEDMLLFLMPKLKVGERKKRFNDWQQSKVGGSLTVSAALSQFEEYRARLIGKTEYSLIAGSFTQWWNDQKSKIRSQSGALGNKRKKTLASSKRRRKKDFAK